MSKKKEGLLIVLEGSDGSGKSTQAGKLVEWMNNDLRIKTTHVREPGSTKLAEGIRRLLLDRRSGDLNPLTEALLFCAARSELYREIINPELIRGRSVASERDYFSTLCYQGQGHDVAALHRICRESVGYIIPDLTLLYKPTSPEIALERGIAGREADRIEAKDGDFHRRVYDMYYNIVPDFLRKEEGRRIEIIDATKTIEEVAEETKRIVRELVDSRS